MTERIEHDLRGLFNERVDSAPSPPIPEVLLRHPDRRRRRSGRVVAVVAAAAAVVVAMGGTSIGVGLLGGSADEVSPAGETGESGPPSGGPSADSSATPTIPYIRDGALHVASTTIRTEADQLRRASDTLLATDVYFSQEDGKSARSWILRGEELVPLPFLDDSVVALSPDGTQVVAASYPDPTTTRLTVYDLASGAEDSALDVAAPGSCCESGVLVLRGLDAVGRVYYYDGDRDFVWDPGSADPVAISGAPGDIAQVGPQGVLAVEGSFGSSTQRVLGEVSRSGAFEAVRQLTMPETTETASWSMSGDVVAYTANTGPVVEPRDASSERVPLDVDGMVFSHFVGFESETELLLVAREDSRNSLLRCDTDGSCQAIEDMGGSDSMATTWVFPWG